VRFDALTPAALMHAQESHRIALSWETDLSPLADFLKRSGAAT